MSRVVLVTGCSTGGIGFALYVIGYFDAELISDHDSRSCNEFARQGCKVYATARRIENMGEFSYPTVEKMVLDVNDDAGVASVVKLIFETEGKIDIVVNNAGYISAGPIIDQSIEEVKTVFDTNTFGILRVAKAVIPLMAKRQSGVIVNIGSIVGEMQVSVLCLIGQDFTLTHNIVMPVPPRGMGFTAAVQSISDVLSMECRPFNISVFHVAPGGVQSNIADKGEARFKLPESSLYTAFLPDIMRRIYASQAPGSMPTDDFAKEVVSKALQKTPPLYLCTGANWHVFAIFKWLPKTWVLNYVWKLYSKKDYLSPNVTPTKLSKAHKSRARREPSGVFSLFKPLQIQQFKEAFQLIDHDKDGWVTEGDLKEIFSSLGALEDCARS
ncbi:hypothetical protein C0993_002879 [Termitomyces sp. T159_Od127]|nr:hypothetical protein C0993_002879 [Termitomyces sp. T159_Od127]